jgi:hypothetical protein
MERVWLLPVCTSRNNNALLPFPPVDTNAWE